METGVLTYLPGVEGSIDAVGAHGETFMFVTTNEAPWPVTESTELEGVARGCRGWRCGLGSDIAGRDIDRTEWKSKTPASGA